MGGEIPSILGLVVEHGPGPDVGFEVFKRLPENVLNAPRHLCARKQTAVEELLRRRVYLKHLELHPEYLPLLENYIRFPSKTDVRETTLLLAKYCDKTD
jgi:hypothetical protein